MGYLKKAVSGISWMAALRVFSRGLAVAKIAVLARILQPSQFGLFGIGALVLGLLEMMTETGINIFLIQQKNGISKYLNSAWTVSITRGVVISLFIFLFSGTIASFFNTHDARRLILLISLVPLIRGFINPSVVKFQKNLLFRKLFLFQGFLFFVDAFFAVGIALMTRSELSLVIGMIIAALFEAGLSFVVVGPVPRLAFEFGKIKKIVSRGKWVTGAFVFNYLFHHLDDIVVGKILGTAPLGLYQQAYKISTLPVSEVGEVFNKVTFPVYINFAKYKDRLRDAYLKTLAVIAVLVVPFGAVLFVFAETIVRIVLGEGWLGAVPALKILAVFGVLKAVSNSAFSVFLAVEKQEIVTLVCFVSVLFLAAAVVPLTSRFGIVGAAYSSVIGAVAGLPITAFYLYKLLGGGKK